MITVVSTSAAAQQWPFGLPFFIFFFLVLFCFSKSKGGLVHDMCWNDMTPVPVLIHRLVPLLINGAWHGRVCVWGGGCLGESQLQAWRGSNLPLLLMKTNELTRHD